MAEDDIVTMDSKKKESRAEEFDIRERLMNLPNEIKDKELKVLKKSDEVAELELRYKLLEEKTANEVHNTNVRDTKDGDVKLTPKFSNEFKRKIEVGLRLKKNTSYQEMTKEIKKGHQDLAVWKIELSYMKRLFRSAESFARIHVE